MNKSMADILDYIEEIIGKQGEAPEKRIIFVDDFWYGKLQDMGYDMSYYKRHGPLSVLKEPAAVREINHGPRNRWGRL